MIYNMFQGPKKRGATIIRGATIRGNTVFTFHVNQRFFQAVVGMHD